MNDAKLTDREMQVLRGVWDGLDPKAIAIDLGLSHHYIRGVEERIRLKLQAANRVLVVRRALERGLLKV